MTRNFVDFGIYSVVPGSVNLPPTASFTATPSASGLTVLLDASGSSDPDGTITHYSWDPGDGGVWGPNAVSYTETYAAAGTYTVTLYVKDNGGIERSTKKTVTVVGSGGGTGNVAPTASFTVGATNLVASANGVASIDQDGNITNYDWNWGDGSAHTSGTSATATHTYATAGTYTVTLTVTDNAGSTGTATHSIAVSGGTVANQAPTAAFSWSPASLAISVNGTSSSDSDGSIAAYDWNWGDSTTHGTNATAGHTYASGGSYNVTLTVTDNQGATDSVTHTVSVTSPSSSVPAWDHMVVVMLENSSLTEVYNSSNAPWMTAFANGGVRFSQSFAITHPSEPNYVALFSGSTQGISTSDPGSGDGHYDFPGSTPQIAKQMAAAGKTFKAYSEDLPSIGYLGDSSSNYVRRHAPWVTFQLNGGFDGNLHVPFTQWQQSSTFYASLPKLSYVIPNVKNDAHDPSTRSTAISTADAWLSSHLDGYWQWAKTHNSMLMVQFDEDDHSANNHIYTAIGGEHCPAGTVYSGSVNHYSFLGLMEDVMGLSRIANSVGQPTITGCWS